MVNIMKKIVLLVSILLLAFGCSDNPDDGDLTETPIVELEVSPAGGAITSRRAEGKISSLGEVDRYHLRLVETGRILQIKCASDTIRPDVDLLVHVLEEDNDGKLALIAGKHAPEDAIQPPELKLNIYVDRPKDLYVHVRDLRDDEYSNNPYYLTAYYEAAPDGNGTFETAVSLTPGSAAYDESIGNIGDVDCFSFSVTQSGVYDAFVNFNPIDGSSIRLSMDLYAPDGTLIEKRTQGNQNTTHMVHYLSATNPGESYKLVVDDEGKDDFDAMSVYSVSINPLSAEEIVQNDTPATAMDALPSSFNGASIDYYEDIDWYRLSVSETGDIDVMDLGFNSEINMAYRLGLYVIHDDDLDTFNISAAAPVYSHDFNSVRDPEYHAVLKLDPLAEGENYYLSVQPQTGAAVNGLSPYDLSAEIQSIVDVDEPENNSDSTPVDLSTTPSYSGKVAYRGDADWYKVTIDPLSSSDRILSVHLSVPSNTNVEYAVDIRRDIRTGEDAAYRFNKQLRHTSSDFRNVDLKTGFVVPGQADDPGLGIMDATYYIKVYDFQNDDGEDAAYTLTWDIADIPGAPAAITGVSSPVYNDEKQERNSGNTTDYTGDVTLTYAEDSSNFLYPRGTSLSYRVNNIMMDLAAGTAVTSGDTTTITMPWVSGYVDYQGDEDWYGLDLSNPLNPEDTMWYYEINVAMKAADNPVEYVWDYFPDSNHDENVDGGICADFLYTSCNGIANMGGETTLSSGDLDSTYPPAGVQAPWIGSRDDQYAWKGLVYFRVRDFNFLRLDEDGTVNPNADDDWGYDAPYFFRVMLTYHRDSNHAPDPVSE